MQRTGLDFGSGRVLADFPLLDEVATRRAEDRSVEPAFEQRRRPRSVLRRIGLDDALAELTVGDVRVLCYLREQRVGEQAKLLCVVGAARQKHLGRRLDGLGREEGYQSAFGRCFRACCFGFLGIKGKRAARLGFTVDAACGGLRCRRLRFGFSFREGLVGYAEH